MLTVFCTGSTGTACSALNIMKVDKGSRVSSGRHLFTSTPLWSSLMSSLGDATCPKLYSLHFVPPLLLVLVSGADMSITLVLAGSLGNIWFSGDLDGLAAGFGDVFVNVSPWKCVSSGVASAWKEALSCFFRYILSVTKNSGDKMSEIQITTALDAGCEA